MRLIFASLLLLMLLAGIVIFVTETDDGSEPHMYDPDNLLALDSPKEAPPSTLHEDDASVVVEEIDSNGFATAVVTNLSDRKLWYIGYSRAAPLHGIEVDSSGHWNTVIQYICGTGLQRVVLRIGRSDSFNVFIDPELSERTIRLTISLSPREDLRLEQERTFWSNSIPVPRLSRPSAAAATPDTVDRSDSDELDHLPPFTSLRQRLQRHQHGR